MLWLEGSEKLLPVLLTLKNQRDRKAGRRITLAAEEGHWIHRVNTSVVCVPPKSFTHLYTLPCPQTQGSWLGFLFLYVIKNKTNPKPTTQTPRRHTGTASFRHILDDYDTSTLPSSPALSIGKCRWADTTSRPGRPTFLLLGLGNTVCKESENNHIMIKHFTLPTGYYKLHNRNKKHGHCRTVWLNARYNTLSISKQKGDNVMKQNNAWKR